MANDRINCAIERKEREIDDKIKLQPCDLLKLKSFVKFKMMRISVKKCKNGGDHDYRKVRRI